MNLISRGLQRLIPVVFLLTFYIVDSSAQAPAGYYSTAQDLTGTALKSALHNIIKGHTTFPYSSGSTDVWDILKLSDRDPANPANVILFYTGWSVNAAQEYNNGAGWNREHVWAKSHGPFDESVKGPGTDCHHLRPADISVNAARGNFYFDYADVPYVDPDGATGCKYNNSRYVWEPRDSEKGDAAREIFYMATRYEGDDGFPDLEVVDYVPTNTSSPLFGVLSTLIEWNSLDPVDAFEMNRNNVVYSFQKNRNPFIDHPEYVDLIWGAPVTPENILPLIENVSYSPAQPTPADILQISANVSDPDGSIKGVRLLWGQSQNNLLNISDMFLIDGMYVADLPSQAGGSEVFFKIEATDNSDAINNSDIQGFSIAVDNTLTEFTTIAGFIYPNPAVSSVHIAHSPDETVIFYSYTGQKLFISQNLIIDITPLNKGLYLIQVVNRNGSVLKSSRLLKY